MNELLLYFFYMLLSKQALASERELVLGLLDPDVGDTGLTASQFSKSQNGSGKTDSDLTFVLDRIFEGVCRPFKVRVEQVLQSQPSLIISYKLSNTLEFYSYTVSRALFLLYSLFSAMLSFVQLFVVFCRYQIYLGGKQPYVILFGC